jgi:hypothetical protein
MVETRFEVAGRVTARWVRGIVRRGSTFEEWVRGRRFRNPNPRGRLERVLFRSLPKSEQDRIRAWWERRSGGAGVAEVPRVKDPLYHTTSYASLKAIAESGLVPRRGGGVFSHGGYGEHSQNKVFLSARPEAARAWQSRVHDQLEDRYGDEELAKRVPVMLRVRARRTRRDEVGDRDVPGSRYTKEAVPPEDIEFWDPGERQWVPVEEWEEADVEHAVSERTEHGVHVDPQAFMPRDEDAFERDDNAVRRVRQRAEAEAARTVQREQLEREQDAFEERERKFLEPDTRRKWIEKIKAEGAKGPSPALSTRPGVFPTWWQHRLKVDEEGNPLPSHPLADENGAKFV